MILPALVLALNAQSPTRLALETEGGEIYIASLDGRSVVKIADGRRPVWSPDGTKVAFGVPNGTPAKPDDGPPVDLFVISADGTARRKLASGVHAEGFEWKWTPDSKSLVFVKQAKGDFNQAWLATLGGTSRLLGPVCAGEFDYALVSPQKNEVTLWQAIGKWTADDMDDSKHHHEFVRYRASAKPKIMGPGVDARYSPNGRWLAYDHEGKLMIASGDGSGPKPRGKMEADEAGYCSFDWLADSSGIVFVEGGTRSVVFMRPDGSGKRSLAAIADSVWVSPAGKKILAFTDSGMQLVDAATGKKSLVYDDIDFVPIGWSSDGSRLYFSSFTEAGTVVRWHRPDGSKSGEFNAGRATFEIEPLSPRGNVLVGSGEKGLTLFQANGTAVRIIEGQRVMRYSWTSR